MHRDEKNFSGGDLTEKMAKRWVEIKNVGLIFGVILGVLHY